MIENSVEFLTGNRILNAGISAWIIAQALKVIFILLFKKKWDFHRFFGSGGMPSSHSASVIAIAASTWKVCGTASPEFGIAVALALIVMNDAIGVRRAAGEQAKVLNYMKDNWGNTTPELFAKDLKELLGHTPIEVLAGAALGLGIGLLM